MPKTIGTFCNASRSHLAVTRTPHVWISEDVLSETFTTFVRNHKRFGSNVPGPLEARRRTSKRRATHLAHQPATSYSPEAFGLFDTQSQDGWWRKPDDSTEPHATSWTWPFTFPRVAREPPPPPRPMKIEDVLGAPTATHQEADPGSVESQINIHLRDIRTHTEAIGILSHLRLDLRRSPHLAEVVLRFMLGQQWRHEEIAEFLLDPWTNPPGTRNHVYILEHAEKHAGLTTWLLQEDIFTRAARLGLLDILEIQKMLLVLPKLQSPDTPGNSTWASTCSLLLTAMDESKVLTVRDLEKSFLTDWLEAIPSYSFDPAVPSLLWRICRLLSLGNGEALEKVAHTSISMIEKTTIYKLSSLVDFLKSQPYEHVGPVLFSLTERFLGKIESVKPDRLLSSPLDRSIDKLFREDLLRQVGGASDSTSPILKEKEPVQLVVDGLIRSHGEITGEKTPETPATRMLQSRFENVSKLELWYAVLGNLGSTAEFQFEMDSSPLKNFVLTRSEGPEAIQQLMTAVWVTTALSVRDGSFIKLSGVSEALGAELRRHFLTATASGEDVLVKLLEALQLTPLPAKNKLLRRIHELSGKLITVKANYWDLVQVLRDLNEARVLRIGDRTTYQTMSLHFPVKLREMCEGFNEDMIRFEKSCVGIVRHVKGNIAIVYRLLHHNQELQRALHLAGLMTDSSHHRLERPLRSQIELVGGRSPLELLDMIERLAHEIAKSQQVSSRNAFRKVYWLKRYLVNLRIPIRSAMWKALWHARVTRQDQEGGRPCYYTVSWLYNKIAKTDGQAEADRLLRVSSMALVKMPDEIDITKRPSRVAQREDDDVLRSASVEGAEVVEVLPFNSSGRMGTTTLCKEPEPIRKPDKQNQEKSTRRPEDVEAIQNVKIAEIVPLSVSGSISLPDQKQGLRMPPADKYRSIISMRSEILHRVPKTSASARYFRATLPEHILERRLLQVLSKATSGRGPVMTDSQEGYKDEA